MYKLKFVREKITRISDISVSNNGNYYFHAIVEKMLPFQWGKQSSTLVERKHLRRINLYFPRAEVAVTVRLARNNSIRVCFEKKHEPMIARPNGIIKSR